MKMSDVFNGKVVVDSSSGAVGGGCVEIGDDNGWVAHFGVYHERDINESNELAIYSAHAINNHDRLTEENKQLRDLLRKINEGNCAYIENGKMYEDIENLLSELGDE